jgi:hypothetical protein
MLRCAVYTRVLTEHGLEQEFNSLDNQREASEAYVKSQVHEGWKLIRTRYDDGAPERLRCNFTRRHRARRPVSNDDRDRACRGDGE